MRSITRGILLLGIVALVSLAAGRAYAGKLICIDPGHGGHDSGAVGCGLKEKDVVLDVALKLKDYLESAGFRVIMTRSTDVFISLSRRTSYANSHGADRFVSIHANSASSSSASGIETYCARNASSQSRDMRDKIQEEMLAVWDLPNRGGRTAGYYVLRHTNMPATLTELGFIINCNRDARYLSSDSHRAEAALAHLRALMRHFGISGDVPDIPDEPQQGGNSNGKLMGVVYEDVGVGPIDTTHRLEGATVEVVETGDTTTAQGPNALWSFTLAPGRYTVRVSKHGYYESQRTCTVSAGGTTWCSVGLTKASMQGEAKGVVMEADTNNRLPGAIVTVMETGDTATAAPESAFWAFRLNPGTYTIKAQLNGYQDGTVSCTVTAGGTSWCSITLQRSTPGMGIAAGVVYKDFGNGDTSERLPGAMVRVIETDDVTTAAGATAYWSFELPAGLYTIRADLLGYEPNSVNCAVVSGQTTWCSIGLRMQIAQGVAKGVVYEDRGNGEADLDNRLPGATVKVVETGDTTTAAPDTALWEFNLSAGFYTIEASLSGYYTNRVTCGVLGYQESWCSIGLRKITEGLGELKGVVYEDRGNGDMSHRLPAAQVTVLETGDTVDASPTSAFWSFTLPEGTYTVQASLYGYYTNQRVCEVNANASTWCSIGLVRTP